MPAERQQLVSAPRGALVSRPPSGLLRIGLRLPIWLYRLHLGWLLSDRCLLLTHTGRKSGRPRQTVIEVVRHDRASDVCVVGSGWGGKSDWFRNIQHAPHVTVTLGRRSWGAKAAVLSEAEAAGALHDYARRHPIAFRELATIILGRRLSDEELNRDELARAIPLVAFYPEQPRTSG